MPQPDPLKDFSAAQVLAGLHPFQRDAAAYAFQRLYTAPDSTGRFLVADEVGLGKTLIARGVLALALEWLRDRVDRIDVVYICSNLAIARQNINRLNPIRDVTFAPAERITLLPLTLKEFAKNRINFVAFTPGTSLDLGNSLGTSRERELLYALLADHWSLSGASPYNVLAGTAERDRFRDRARELRAAGELSPALVAAFRGALDRDPSYRTEFEAVCERFARVRDRMPDEDRRLRGRCIGRLRALLATICIGALEPDLVILDEFQRFKSLLEPGSEEGELARQLFEWQGEHVRSRVLLLSATPYKPYTTSVDTENHYEDFVTTASFLERSGPQPPSIAGPLKAFRAELCRAETASVERLVALKHEIEGKLRAVMSRTERLAATAIENGMLKSVAATDVRAQADDVAAYRRIGRVLDALDAGDGVEYWKSGAYPLNFMEGYQFSVRLDAALEGNALEPTVIDAFTAAAPAMLPFDTVDAYRPLALPNARLRSLQARLDDEGAFETLWLPPSLPYYGLADDFAKVKPGLSKHLIFSAWALVPRSVAALLSYEAERRAFTADEREPLNTLESRKTRRGLLRFSESEGRLAGMPILTLVYPSAVLAGACDPREYLRARPGSAPTASALVAWAEERVRELLAPLVDGTSTDGPEDEMWYWAAPLLLDRHSDESGTIAWWTQRALAIDWAGASVSDDEDEPSDVEGAGALESWLRHAARAQALVASGARPAGRVPEDLARALAEMALGGPATVALRSLLRTFPDAGEVADLARRNAAARIGWGFRSLYNRPEGRARVRRGRERPYWRLALEYGVAGCLSAVMDEYVHVLAPATGVTAASIPFACEQVASAAVSALQVRSARVDADHFAIDPVARSATRTKRPFRTLFAMRLSDRTEDADQVARNRAVGQAFNSPFWPFVLVTTSAGQEGLDFHWYCHSVLHWNLPSNPVDLEQREGRVNRFKGHAVRKNAARRFGSAALESHVADVWQAVFELAREHAPQGDRGLIPYWLFPVEDGAWIERGLLLYPFSRDEQRYAALKKALGAYRMVFGQPRQDELLAYLMDRLEPAALAKLAGVLRMDLAPPHHGTFALAAGEDHRSDGGAAANTIGA